MSTVMAMTAMAMAMAVSMAAAMAMAMARAREGADSEEALRAAEVKVAAVTEAVVEVVVKAAMMEAAN